MPPGRPFKTCPNCAQQWYDFYANGNWREGYCQFCSYEDKIPTTEVANMPPQPTLSMRERATPKAKEKTDKQFKKNER